MISQADAVPGSWLYPPIRLLNRSMWVSRQTTTNIRLSEQAAGAKVEVFKSLAIRMRLPVELLLNSFDYKIVG